MRLPALVLSVALLALVPVAPAAAHGDKSPKVVASGLDNPRGLDVDKRGVVYVTEAGRGGDLVCLPGPEGEICAGSTGAVTKAWHGGQKRILEGLPSFAAPDGSGAIGPSDIELTWWDSALLTVGLGADPAVRDQVPEIGSAFGQLYKLSRHRGVRAVADIAGYEATANPDGGLPDSNPHSVTSRWGKAYVADAGGNSLVKVRRHGDISTVAVFPDQPVDAPPGLPPVAQAVPTSVAVGPDGALYVGQLTGFPFVPGAANVFRIGKDGALEVYAGGFTNVTGIDFDRHGRLYVVEFASNGILSGDPTGALIRVNPDGSRETLVSDLVNPTAVVVGRKGVYVSNHGSEAGAGEVLRFRF
jgi:hypothetical protein